MMTTNLLYAMGSHLDPDALLAGERAAAADVERLRPLREAVRLYARQLRPVARKSLRRPVEFWCYGCCGWQPCDHVHGAR